MCVHVYIYCNLSMTNGYFQPSNILQLVGVQRFVKTDAKKP